LFLGARSWQCLGLHIFHLHTIGVLVLSGLFGVTTGHGARPVRAQGRSQNAPHGAIQEHQDKEAD
jgi:hypothetical protein